jgi:hypothetical protein
MKACVTWNFFFEMIFPSRIFNSSLLPPYCIVDFDFIIGFHTENILNKVLAKQFFIKQNKTKNTKKPEKLNEKLRMILSLNYLTRLTILKVNIKFKLC